MRLGMELAVSYDNIREHKTDSSFGNKKKGDGFWFIVRGLILSEPGTQELDKLPGADLAMLIKTLNEGRRADFPWTRAPGDRAEV